MAKDLPDHVRDIVSHAARDAVKNFDGNGLSGARGVAAGAGALALAPLAAKGIGKLARGVGADGLADAPSEALEGLKSKVGDGVKSKVGETISGKLSEKVDEVGGPGGALKQALKSVLPFGGGGSQEAEDGKDGKGGVPGVGKGRRMPVQQSVDIGVPLETVYNQWTQFEEWPTFMHRVKRVTQEDDCTVSFQTKIWGKTKEFKAQIVTQRPDERIKWRVSEGMTHAGVVSFHELGPQLTRVLLNLDVEPGGMLEKAARGMRFVKRAARADLHRFAALIEMQERETGAWRGVIENGKVVEKHKRSYDRGRDYTEAGDVFSESDSDSGSESQQSEGSSRRGRQSSRNSQGSRGNQSSRRGGSHESSGRQRRSSAGSSRR
jgi:uncharacterized membrane protein